jgi:hypothetical protein
MAKVKCYTPEGIEEMKEPGDAREAVESCGYTMEPSESLIIKEEVIEQEEVEEIEVPIVNKRGRKGKNR